MTLSKPAHNAAINAEKGEFVISRLFDAPRDLVWKAWTEPERLKHWWGPKGVKIVSCKVDLRPDGVFHYGMRVPDGQEMWGKFIYREIVRPERLVFIVSFSDKDGGVTRHPFVPNWPMETLSTVLFDEQGAKTRITVKWVPHSATEAERKAFADGHASMQQGWSGTFDQLADYLAKAMTARDSSAEKVEGDLVIRRLLDAPRERVFKAWSDPKGVAQWWGPHGFTNPVCELDVRPGGAIRIDMRGPDGTVYPMRGVYREIVEPERLGFASAALDEAGDPLFEVLTTVTFAAQGGKTTLTLQARVVKRTAKAAPYLAGMEAGWTQSLERLEAWVAKTRGDRS